MVTTALNPSPVGVGIVGKQKNGPVSAKVPASSAVKLEREMFVDVWWICRVEGKAPGDLLKELAGVQAAARRKRHEAVIAKLAKLDEAEDEIVSRAKSAGAESE